MSKTYEFQGKNVDQALQQASSELNIPVEKIKHEVVAYGSSGIFGLVGVKKAKIKVFIKERQTTNQTTEPAPRERKAVAEKETLAESKPAEKTDGDEGGYQAGNLIRHGVAGVDTDNAGGKQDTQHQQSHRSKSTPKPPAEAMDTLEVTVEKSTHEKAQIGTGRRLTISSTMAAADCPENFASGSTVKRCAITGDAASCT